MLYVIEKIMKITLLLTAFTLFIISNTYALHDVFPEIDVNRDNRIDREEFSEDMKKSAFKKVDTDTSSEISEEEWMGLDNITIKEKHRALFQIMDKNNDKRITFFEFSAYSEEHSNIEEAFIGLDLDKDGALSPDEISSRPVFRMITIYF